MHDRTIWKTAPSLWRDGLAGAVALDRPVVLRFDTDDFMTRLQANLDDADARDLGAFVLRSETWKEPAVGLDAPAGLGVPRLYQPTHGRFYVAGGGLVCERYGLPDKAIHPECGESTFAVLRRLEPVGVAAVDVRDRTTYREYGWVPGGANGTWTAIDARLGPGEERLPLFPMTYVDERRRRMLACTLPVAARERYEGALPPAPVTSSSTDPAAVLAKPGRARLETVVVGLQALLALADTPNIGDPAAFELYREATFFALVDLAGFLADELPDVFAGTAASGTTAGALVALLNGVDFRSDAGTPTWMTALHQAHANRDVVLAALATAPSPVTGVSIVDVVGTPTVAGPPTVYGRGVVGLGVAEVDTVADDLFILVERALSEQEATQPIPAAAAPPSTPPPSRMTGAVYAIRFVYERPRCRLPDRHTVSEPSEPFRLAHFYDPDAPFRDHRIVLPIDTSLEGLRKFPRAVRMDLSSQLRKQMDRIQAIKLGDLDEGEIPDEQPLDLGMVCSMSIPIITICALVLLMIIVSLLNIVFFWIPLFKICLPKGDG